MRILHVTAPGATGGLERVVVGLATALRERGHDAAVLASVGSTAGDHPFVCALRAAAVPVHVLGVGGRAYRAELAGIRGVLDAFTPDVVHTHGFRSDVLGLLAARSRDLPAASTVHGLTGGDWKVRTYERIQRFALRRFDAVIAVSATLHDDFLRSGFRPERVHRIRNALVGRRAPLERAAARAALDLPAEGPAIGWVGRFGAEKGPDVFIGAVARLDAGVTAVMIGDGPERAPVAERARDLGLQDRVRLPGILDAADRYLLAFDAIALSSRTEGTPMILLEAMAAGVPVVTTSVGGVPDVVGPQEAVLVPPEQPAALARGLASVLDAPADAAARARRARARLDAEFAVEPWVKAYEEVYRGIIEGRRP